VDMDPNWEFYQERDYRTLKNLPGRPDIEQENEHHALADAEYQATVAEQMLDRFALEIKGTEL
ncbi:3'-5' exoribonuclease domain-containing protein, partial [Escherichia coli]|uniref:3'-5' exoribonuclease domain-containing protein n=1 Tax=Escherichia coli TaxID=562 RepID=UPI00398B2456